MTLYLGENLISGVTTPVEGARNIGQIVQSTLPLNDAGLHLIDGALIQGSGIYSALVIYIAGLVNTYPDLFTTETDWQTAVTTYGSCDKYVYDKVNNTVRLPKRTSEHGYLIKSYKSDTNWYRIYSDGWCEQGGVSPSAGDGSTNTITLLKSYKDTNYSILFAQNAGVEGSYTNGCTAKNKTTNSFVLVYRTGGTASFYWNTCGYIDISDYQYSPIYEYIVIATSTKTDVEVNIDNIATDLNGKADIDGSNMVASVKNFDGQPVIVNQTVYSAKSAGSVDLSTIIPNDGYIYECVINAYAQISSSYIVLTYSMNGQSASVPLSGADLSANTFTFYSNSTDKVLTITTSGTGSLSDHKVSLQSFRRVGTNE